jgi:hypothetical protein
LPALVALPAEVMSAYMPPQSPYPGWQNASLYRLPFGGKLYALEYSGGELSIAIL